MFGKSKQIFIPFRIFHSFKPQACSTPVKDFKRDESVIELQVIILIKIDLFVKHNNKLFSPFKDDASSSNLSPPKFTISLAQILSI